MKLLKQESNNVTPDFFENFVNYIIEWTVLNLQNDEKFKPIFVKYLY